MATVERTAARIRNGNGVGEMLDRQPPRSIEAERAVLGSLLLLPEACDEVALVVRPDDFYDDANRRIFGHMLALHDGGQQIDLTLLGRAAARRPAQYESVGGAAYLARARPGSADRRPRRVLRPHRPRQGGAPLADPRQHRHPSGRLRTRRRRPRDAGPAEERVFAILDDQRRHGRSRRSRDVLHESLARIDARMQHQHAFGGVETGFVDFDELTGGLHNSELIDPRRPAQHGQDGAGAEHRRARRDATARHAGAVRQPGNVGARAGRPAALLACAEVNSHRLRNGTITHDDRRKLVEAAAEISQAPLFIDDSPSRT